MVKILVCDPIHEDGVQMLRGAGFTVDLETEITSEELIEEIGEYDAIVIRSRTKVTKGVLDAAEKLKAIARAGVGLDNINLEYSSEKNIEIFNSPEAPCNAVAELVIGMMFNMARNIAKANIGMKQGRWEKKKLTGFEIENKTLGIIGFGRIGYTLGKKAKCLGMRVIAYDVAMDRVKKYIDEIEADAVDLDTLLNDSHFITVHVPLLPQTKHMISTEEFNKMRKGVYIINAARGGVIDETELKEALDSGKVQGAALDVFEREPNPDEDLISRVEVICTPHIGAGSVEAQRGNSTIVAEKLINYFNN
ncbi:3-phosphoglycerate dehydrogenase [Candidatus Bathyarchaeota archaeon]|nr:3-phosphoglycerate dehydrogenase [Candidatus Bathyarchaeota archaeon]